MNGPKISWWVIKGGGETGKPSEGRTGNKGKEKALWRKTPECSAVQAAVVRVETAPSQVVEDYSGCMVPRS